MIIFCNKIFDATPEELREFKTDWRRQPDYMWRIHTPDGKVDLAKRELRIRDEAIMGDLGWARLWANLPTLNEVSDYFWRKRAEEMQAEFQDWLDLRRRG